ALRSAHPIGIAEGRCRPRCAGFGQREGRHIDRRTTRGPWLGAGRYRGNDGGSAGEAGVAVGSHLGGHEGSKQKGGEGEDGATRKEQLLGCVHEVILPDLAGIGQQPHDAVQTRRTLLVNTSRCATSSSRTARLDNTMEQSPTRTMALRNAPCAVCLFSGACAERSAARPP